MTGPTGVILRRFANLTCALEDYQAFAEADDLDYLARSRQLAADNIAAIRTALYVIEHAIGLPLDDGEQPGLRVVDRPSDDDWDTAA